MDRRQLLKSGTVAAMGGLAPKMAWAQAGTRRILYPFAPGDLGDTLARIVANALQEQTGTTTLVENRAGADGRIAVRDVKGAPSDGTMLLVTPFAQMSLFPTVFANLPYDPFRDFEPITQLASFDFGLAVGKKTNAKTAAEFVDWVKKNPNDGNYATPAMGSAPHFLPLLFAKSAGIKLVPVVFKGVVPSITAAMAGDVPLVCSPLGDMIPQHQAGNIRIIASSGRARSPFTPDVPTLSELGFKVSASAWFGLFAPAGTPNDMVERFNRIAVTALKSDATTARLKPLFVNATATTPGELGAVMKADFDLWAPVIKEAGFAGK